MAAEIVSFSADAGCRALLDMRALEAGMVNRSQYIRTVLRLAAPPHALPTPPASTVNVRALEDPPAA